jgi:hypothetical protein
MDAREFGRPVRGMLAVAVIVSVAALTACSSPEPVVDADTLASIQGLVILPPEISIAHQVSTTQCLRTAGFNVPLDTAAGAAGPALAGVVGLFTSASDARATGYSTTVEQASDGGIDGFRSTLSKADAKRFDLSLWGDGKHSATLVLDSGAKATKSTTGCFADADRAIYGDVKSAMAVTASETVLGSTP